MTQFVFSSYQPDKPVANVKFVNVLFKQADGLQKAVTYGFTNKTGLKLRQGLDLAKDSGDSVLFRTKAGFSEISFAPCKTHPTNVRLLSFDGLINVVDPINERTNLGLESVFGKSLKDELDNQYIYVGPEPFRKSFSSQVQEYCSTDVDELKNPPKGEYIFQTKINSHRPNLKGINVIFPNGDKIQYVYGPENQKYIDAAIGLNQPIWFDKTYKGADDQMSNIHFEYTNTVNNQARELIFVGARNVRNINQFRKEIGLPQVRGQRLHAEDEYFTVYALNDTDINRKTGESLFNEFLERSSHTVSPSKPSQQDTVTLSDKENPDRFLKRSFPVKSVNNSKYELLLDDVKEVTYNTKYMTNKVDKVYRIRALKNFGDVKVGDLGGYVSSEKNLGHSGKCWIYDDSVVTGTGKVTGDSKVCDNSFIYSNVSVRGNSLIKNSSINNKQKETLKIIDEEIIDQSIGKKLLEPVKSKGTDETSSIEDLDKMLSSVQVEKPLSDEELFEIEIQEYTSELESLKNTELRLELQRFNR